MLPKQLLQMLLLKCALRPGIHVLQRAAAADAKMRTARLHTLRRRLQNFDELALLIPPPLSA